MKNLLLVGLLLSFTAMSSLAKTIEPGLYNAVDVDSGTITAQLVIDANGTLNFKVQTPDFQMPDPGCDGVYTVVGESFKSDLKCPISILPEVSVNIDVTSVNPQSVRSADGALVPVVIDALGTDATMFRLKIVEPGAAKK
jgi:hypothetical protein